MWTLFSVVGSLYVPTNSSVGAVALVATWVKAYGAKHDTSARKRMSMRVVGRRMALESVRDLFFTGHRSNEIAAGMMPSLAKPAGTVALFFGNFTHDFHGFSAAHLTARG